MTTKEATLLLGKKVRRKNRSKWEEGIIVNEDDELFIQFAEDDWEALYGNSFQVWDEDKQEWIDSRDIDLN